MLYEEDATTKSVMRKFETGATRDGEDGKNDYEGFMSPLAIEAFGDYMTRHRQQRDGGLRDSDNWQKGIPISAYVKSLVRHTIDLWMLRRGYIPKRLALEMPGRTSDAMAMEAACAVWFNVQGFIHETIVSGRGRAQA